MDQLRIWAAPYGDVASVAGLVISVIGFAVTIVGVWLSKTAAEQARKAARDTRASLAQYDAIADLSSATTMMDEIKRLQRHGAWAVLPDRYGALRRRLVALKSSDTFFTDQHRLSIQGTIEKFADLERRIEKFIAVGTSPPNPAKLNEIVSAQLDEIHAVLLVMQRSLRGTKDGREPD